MAAPRKRKRELTDEILRPYFAAEISRLLEKDGRSREKLADEAGMDPGTLRRLEKGHRSFRNRSFAPPVLRKWTEAPARAGRD